MPSLKPGLISILILILCMLMEFGRFSGTRVQRVRFQCSTMQGDLNLRVKLAPAVQHADTHQTTWRALPSQESLHVSGEVVRLNQQSHGAC